ncbi:MAG TPA: ribokinase [Tepidisphaeraceae bacterium]|jgi:ribokinase|nr:ribokinase [Tepidisphaeraceae bacterium]
MPAPNTTKPIVVIGSINMDLVVRTPRIPGPGETVIGQELNTIPGGKGANQAVAAAKLASAGTTVHMVGRVGDDDIGQRLLNGLSQYGVHTNHMTVTEGVASGAAMILVDDQGENTIVTAPGANGKLSPRDIDAAEQLIASAAVVLLQLEVPIGTVAHALELCKRHKVFTILDPAPAPAKRLPKALYGVDIFSPNEHEADALLGFELSAKTPKIADPKQVGSRLLARGPGMVVLKLGRKGAMIVGPNGQIETVKPFKVKVVDTTAAGDAFIGGVAVAIAEGQPPVSAVRFGNAAGAVACTSFGAQPALPTRAAVMALVRN